MIRVAFFGFVAVCLCMLTGVGGGGYQPATVAEGATLLSVRLERPMLVVENNQPQQVQLCEILRPAETSHLPYATDVHIATVPGTATISASACRIGTRQMVSTVEGDLQPGQSLYVIRDGNQFYAVTERMTF